MADGNSDIPWLVGLEATLSFSAAVWAPSASGRTAAHPVEFFLVLLAAAAACAVIFHVAPACFAARYGQPGPGTSWALVPIGVGYLVCSTRLLMTMSRQLPFEQPRPSQVTVAVFVLLVVALALVRSWWKTATILALLTGVGLSLYMLATPWHGIWTGNSRFAQDPYPDSRCLTEGLSIAIAPALAIAWRIGCLERRRKRIWFTAFHGVFLPLLMSVFIAALMAQAGENLFWRPSLFLDFSWALQGRSGRHSATAWKAITVLVGLSLAGPALLSALSVRLLAATFDQAKKLTLGVVSSIVISWLLVNQPDLGFYPPYDTALILWTLLLATLGIAGGLACFFGRRVGRTAGYEDGADPETAGQGA